MLRRNNLHREGGDWEFEGSKAIIESSGRDFKYKMRALSLAAVVYLIWQERNYRIFRNMGQDWNQVLTKVEELIREATWKWRIKRSYENWVVCME